LNKKNQHFYEAEKMYVYHRLSAVEIASRLNLCEKTVRLWSKEGKWADKRNEFLKFDMAFHEEMYQFSRKLMRMIEYDLDNGIKTNASQLYTFAKTLTVISKVKDYEDTVAKKDKRKRKGLSPEIIRQIEEEILGIEHNEPKEVKDESK